MGLCLIVALLFATLSCGFLPPLNTSALVVNRTNYVSACGLNVLTYTVNGRQPYYYDFVLTPVLEGEIQNVAFVAFLAPYGPSTSDTFLNAFDPGCAPYSCRSNSSAGCSISVVCNGDQSKPFFAYVRTTNGAEGLFSIDLVVRRMFFLAFSFRGFALFFLLFFLTF